MAEGSVARSASASFAAADGSPSWNASTAELVAHLKSFAAGHGGATAVIEYVGRRGARIVLEGQDGAHGDGFTESTQTAREVCARAGVQVDNGWERELVEQMRPSNDLWRNMGRRVVSR